MSLSPAKSEAHITGAPPANFAAGTAKRTAAQLAKPFQSGKSKELHGKNRNR
jgi:hypothetical protein